MDRSFLSQPQVVRASRRWVCIRLATYENAAEVALLGQIFRGRSGQVENTTFALLSPDARHLLVRPGRSPDFAFSNAEEMARAMETLATHYSPRAEPQVLPSVPSLRLALNLAACEGLPLIAAVSPDPARRAQLERHLAELAWHPALQGRAVFTADGTAEARRLLSSNAQGLVVIKPGIYGLDGRVTALLPDNASAELLELTLAPFQATDKDPREHVRRGREQGVYWRTATPVTDPHGPR